MNRFAVARMLMIGAVLLCAVCDGRAARGGEMAVYANRQPDRRRCCAADRLRADGRRCETGSGVSFFVRADERRRLSDFAGEYR